MADPLASALNELSLNTKALKPASVEARLAEEEAGTFGRREPRKQSRQSADDLLKDLEDDFLKPSATFSPKWLNQLQK
jgi:antiviral helicase SKI2